MLIVLLLFGLLVVYPNAIEAQTGWVLVGPPDDKGIQAGLNKVSGARGGYAFDTSTEASAADVQRAQAVWDRALKVDNEASRMRILIESIYDRNAPAEKWLNIMAFDTAQACEASRIRNFSKYESIAEKLLAQGLSQENGELLTAAIRFTFSRCVPASVLYPQIRK